MGDISKHVSRWEVECKCEKCGFDAADIELVEKIEDCITHFEQTAGKRLVAHFSSWCRCSDHNKAEGGGERSQHLLGKAVDMRIDGIHPNAVANWLIAKYPHKHGIGRYDTFTHFDIRPDKARWDSR